MRILLIAAMVVPLLVNWVVLKGQALGLYDEDFAVLFRVMASVLFLGLVVWEKGSALQLDDARRQELEVQARLVNQARFKDEFLSHVSHELRSPLTAVKQFTTILLGGLGGALTPEQRQYQQIVLKNVLQLQSMIDDLLEVVRLQTGKLALKLHPVSVSDAVAYAVNTLQPVAQDRAVSLAASVPPDLPKAQADESRLQQILVILLDNAIKFTGSGGRIRIEAVRQPDDPRFLRIDVADTGCGMSPGAAEKIFDRLYQVEGTAESSRKGLGLGLHICQELVTRQGGQIRVDSTPGEGSVFSFTLPIAAAPQNLEGSGTAGMDEDVRGLTHGS
jgi:two-component system sensor histidine kinase/response regulator